MNDAKNQVAYVIKKIQDGYLTIRSAQQVMCRYKRLGNQDKYNIYKEALTIIKQQKTKTKE